MPATLLRIVSFAAGHSLLFAVNAKPRHDKVRRTKRLNLSYDIIGITSSRRIAEQYSPGR